MRDSKAMTHARGSWKPWARARKVLGGAGVVVGHRAGEIVAGHKQYAAGWAGPAARSELNGSNIGEPSLPFSVVPEADFFDEG